MFDKFVRFLASGCGLGYIPIASGTFGTLWGCVFYYLMRHYPRPYFIKFTVLFALMSIVSAHLAEKSFKSKDSSRIVIDEVAGALVAYCFVPYSVFHMVLGFILFRLFDIVKIAPARQAQDHLPGGFGVVCDDLVAGAQAGIILLALPALQQGVTTLINWITHLSS